jgi:hypothetical protein
MHATAKKAKLKHSPPQENLHYCPRITQACMQPRRRVKGGEAPPAAHVKPERGIMDNRLHSSETNNTHAERKYLLVVLFVCAEQPSLYVLLIT